MAKSIRNIIPPGSEWWGKRPVRMITKGSSDTWWWKRRLHKKPNPAQVRACNPWLREEIRLVKPKLVVALGSTAAQALLGSAFRVTQHRGEVTASEWAGPVLATVHPSSVLRAPDEYRADARREFFEDVGRVASYLKKAPAATLPRPPRRRSTSRSTRRPRP